MKQIAAALCVTLMASALAAAEPPSAKIVNLGWLSFDGKQADKLMRWKVRYEIPPSASPAQNPSMIEMHWKYTPDTMGMPAPDVMTELARLEAALDPIQGDHIGYLMIIATGNGQRTWLWYTADPKRFASELNNLIPGHPFPITLHLGKNEPDWESYRAMRKKVN